MESSPVPQTERDPSGISCDPREEWSEIRGIGGRAEDKEEQEQEEKEAQGSAEEEEEQEKTGSGGRASVEEESGGGGGYACGICGFHAGDVRGLSQHLHTVHPVSSLAALSVCEEQRGQQRGGAGSGHNRAAVVCLPLVAEGLKLVWTRSDQTQELDGVPELVQAFNAFPYPTAAEAGALARGVACRSTPSGCGSCPLFVVAPPGLGGQGRGRKSRLQLRALRRSFLRDNWLSEAELRRLQAETGLSRGEVRKWFSDSRYQLRSNGQRPRRGRGRNTQQGAELRTACWTAAWRRTWWSPWRAPGRRPQTAPAFGRSGEERRRRAAGGAEAVLPALPVAHQRGLHAAGAADPPAPPDVIQWFGDARYRVKNGNLRWVRSKREHDQIMAEIAHGDRRRNMENGAEPPTCRLRPLRAPGRGRAAGGGGKGQERGGRDGHPAAGAVLEADGGGAWRGRSEHAL
ncbi:hypothetical protein ANANG_G00147590 [Anguilla anguilla]|uniref:Homeobox domain-containing protein n=1 Tax=Anguilla anguilla TaxID=7936 RepID=A0A9D3MC28_ANGAN|nr:hypothetical protein ANANG_G00147590 [Anguilla anguilla]